VADRPTLDHFAFTISLADFEVEKRRPEQWKWKDKVNTFAKNGVKRERAIE
jgi:hypothetical protein